MLQEIAELKVSTDKDYTGKVVKALEEAGFTLVLTCETFIEKHYIVAQKKEDWYDKINGKQTK
jgi:hypothetical protein